MPKKHSLDRKIRRQRRKLRIKLPTPPPKPPVDPDSDLPEYEAPKPPLYFSFRSLMFTIKVYYQAIGAHRFFFLFFFQIVNAIIPTFMAILLGFIVTEITTAISSGHGPLPTIKLLAITFFIQIVHVGLNSVNKYIAEFASQELYIYVSSQISTKYLRIPLRIRESKTFKDRFECVKNFGNRINTVATDFAAIVGCSIACVVSILVSFFAVSPLISIVIIIASLPCAITSLIIATRRRRNWRTYTRDRRIAAKIESQINSPNSSLEIEISGLGQHLIDKMIFHRRRSEEKDLSDNRRFFLPNLFSDIFSSIVEGAVLIVVSLEIIAGRLAIGQFLTVHNLFAKLSANITSIFLNVIRISDDLAYSVDYVYFMNYPEPDEGNIKIDSIDKIEFHNVSLHHEGDETPVLSNINFTVNRGETLAIVGSNGAGKSSIIKLLMGAYRPSSGTIFINDIPLSDINRKSFITHTGVLLQDFTHFDFSTIGENVWYGNIKNKFEEKSIRSALRKANLNYLERKFPRGFRQIISRDIDSSHSVPMSGGEWQRLALARNFFRSPDLLILDEPMSAVDSKASSSIIKEIFASQNKKSTVIISHRFSAARKADHVIVLHHGQILEQGTHKELLANNSLYKEMFDLQAEGFSI